MKDHELVVIGIFLYHSPHHASSALLFLSTQTSLMSLQFHCGFDNNFDTKQHDTSQWQKKAHLQAQKCAITSALHRDQFVTTTTPHSIPTLAYYGMNIPNTLSSFLTLLEQETHVNMSQEPTIE